MRYLIGCVLLLSLGGCIFVRVPLIPEVGKVEERVVEGQGRAKIAMVDLTGTLTMQPLGLQRLSREPSLIPRFREELETARADRSVVGLVLRVDSIGGSVTASDILYHELMLFREARNMPVVVCIMDKALSGGYYAALAADEIMAHPTAVVGGVGVIAWRLNLSEMLNRWGIEVETIKSGELKDFWSPLRGSNPEETVIMTDITDHLQQRFVQLIADHRRISPADMELIVTGRIFHAEQAREMGLIDRVGYLKDAVARVRELAGVEQARTVIYRRPGTYAHSIYATNPMLGKLAILEEMAAEQRLPALHYQLYDEWGLE
jgi:protease IV